ncbi:MAG: DUF58 domain-containing protein [bacterium]
MSALGAPARDAGRRLDPVALSRLEDLDLVARLVVEGFVTGLHRSPYHGFSVEFAEHRPYQPGDALRYLDWRLYAKSDRYYVKTFMEETNLRSHLVMDASGSMGYGSGEITKITYARQLAAALAYLMLRQRDAVGLVTYDERMRRMLPPRSVSSWLHPLLGELEGLETREGTDGGSVLGELAERLDRRGLVILFSDLLDDPRRVGLGLRHLRHRKHEVIVFRVLDSREVDFDFPEEALLEGMEGGEVPYRFIRISRIHWKSRTQHCTRTHFHGLRMVFYILSCNIDFQVMYSPTLRRPVERSFLLHSRYHIPEMQTRYQLFRTVRLDISHISNRFLTAPVPFIRNTEPHLVFLTEIYNRIFRPNRFHIQLRNTVVRNILFFFSSAVRLSTNR